MAGVFRRNDARLANGRGPVILDRKPGARFHGGPSGVDLLQASGRRSECLDLMRYFRGRPVVAEGRSRKCGRWSGPLSRLRFRCS